ncbi:MAG TPA: GspE/PulE family protein [bacterium]|nr:GspE/PulE family protein [bacterium]
MDISDRNLERMLAHHALVDPAQLAEAKLAQEKPRVRPSLQSVLLNMGYVKEELLLQAQAKDLGIPFVDVEPLDPEPAVVMLIPEEMGMSKGVMALEHRGTQLVCAMQDPNDVVTLDLIQRKTKLTVVPQLATRGGIMKKLAEYHDHYKVSVVENLLKTVRDQGKELTQQIGLNIQSLETLTDQAPIIKAVNLIIIGALLKRASDIHLVPEKQYLRVKYRVDGMLQEEQVLGMGDAPAVVSRIKIMAKLDISEKRMPQDGAFQIVLEGREIDFRVATAPTIFGEKVVLRVLDKSGIMLGLDHLGFSDNQLRDIKRQIHRPHGIILIVGPTGSGKTTTLYAALNIINNGDKNITTVEDPVEYKIEGLTQIQTHSEIGLTFAAALRSILRQDPDVVLIGEIRDLETTEIAIRAALTGHLVFATLHTNDASSAVSRLVEMGAEPYLVASALRCAISQRLVRNICTRCREPHELPPELVDKLTTADGPPPPGTQLWRGKGCNYCFGTGYRGRSVVSEMLVVDEAIRAKIGTKSSSAEIQATAVEAGMRPMYLDGVDKVLRGITTLEEILEVAEDVQ